MAYLYVGNGNLEFNQGNYFFEKFIASHPDVHMAPTNPKPGIFLINTNDYMDVWNLHKYAWLGHFKPFGEVAYNGLLIKVSADDLKTNTPSGQ